MALRGVRVVEMAGLIPAPFCGMIMADFGASVIRIDKPRAPNVDRLSRGKRSVIVDVKKPAGQSIVKQLCANADVLIEPYRKGVMEKMGLGPKELLKDNPKLIYARLTGFGQSGPCADMAGHDINFVAMSGLLSVLGRKESPPTPPINLLADFAGGGLICALGIALALYERSKSDQGQVIDANMVEGAAYTGSWIYLSRDMWLWGKSRGNNWLDSGAHFYDTYETRDGRYMAVGAIEPQFYDQFITLLGLSTDEVGQFDEFDAMKKIIGDRFKEKTQEEWTKDLDKSVAAQKTLLQQVQDLENEGREMADFMAEEKNALAECLREAETELVKLRAECKQLSAKIEEKDEEGRQMIRLAEERRNKYMILQSEMNSMQSRTRDMMVCQGAEVSGAAVALANLSSRLQTLIGKLIQDYSITDTDLEMIVTPNESDSSASSTNGTPEHKSPYKVCARTPSPRKTASFITALINAMRLGPKSKINQTGGLMPCSGSKQETEGRNSPEGSESYEVVEHDGNSGSSSSSSMSLTDQVTDVDILLTRFLKVCCVLKNDTDNRLMEIEDENDRLCNQIRSQQQVIDQQQSDYENLNRSEARAKRELMVATRDLELANQNLNKYYQADYEIEVKKLQDEVERLGATIRHLEVLHTEKEKQLEESFASLSAAQGPAPPNHVSEAAHQQEIATLNDKVTSLRQSVIERDRRISELSERHSQDLASIRESQLEAHRSNRRVTTTVDHVLKTLESIPDIVSSNSTLKQLFATLAAAEKSNQQQQNGNINTQNGFGNTVNNKDLNANPQSIIDSGINNKKIVPSIKAETHL